jgi:hypothetical protein
MGIFDAMGSAAGGMMGGGAKAAMGGGNGGSFAQKQMMKANPVMQGGGMGARLGMAQQRPQMASTFGMQGPNKMRPTPNMPFGNQMKQGMGQGIAPRYAGQMGGIAQGVGQQIAPWMQQKRQMEQGPRMPPVQGEPMGGPQRQTMDPNAPGYDPGVAGPQQQGGLQEMLRKMFQQQQQGGGAQTQGGGANDPRWSNGTWGRGNTGIAGGMMNRMQVAPQLSMMPQQMQQPRQPNPYGAGYGEEEMY